MREKRDFRDFEVDSDIELDEEEKELLAGLKESRSIFTKEKVFQLSQIAKKQRNKKV